MLIALSSISQTSNDSLICIPNSQLKKAIVLIEKGKVVEYELSITKDKIDIFQNIIKVKDSVIKIYQDKEVGYKNIVQNQTNIISSSNQIITNLEKNVKLNAKLIRRQKYKKWIVGIIGIGIGIFITK
jgi:hypothetical protein